MLHIQESDFEIQNFRLKKEKIKFECVAPCDDSLEVEFDIQSSADKPGMFEIFLSLKRRNDHQNLTIVMQEALPYEFVPEFLISSILSLDKDLGFAGAIALALIKLEKVSVDLTWEQEHTDDPGEIVVYVTIDSPSGHSKFHAEGHISAKEAKRHVKHIKQ